MTELEKLETATEALRNVYKTLLNIKAGEQDRLKIYHTIGEAQGVARGALMVMNVDTSDLVALFDAHYAELAK